MRNIVILLFFVIMMLTSGCMGTKISVEIPDGPKVYYNTYDSKQISGLEVEKTAKGWKFSLDKSESKANDAMAAALLELVKRVPQP